MTLCNSEKDSRKNAILKMGFSEKTVEAIGEINSGCFIENQDAQARIVHLKKIGFKNPIELIEKLPSILGLAENKISLTARLLEIFGYPYSMKKMSSLCVTNIESLILASLKAQDYTELIRFRKGVKGSTLEKRTCIYERMDELDDEIAWLYQKRYGLKKDFGK